MISINPVAPNWNQRSLPRWLIPTSLFLPILAGTIGWLFPIGFTPSSARLFLTALVGAQASVLAIVFSVTLLGIQLATMRYATRMIHLFVESAIFRFTLFVFLISIAVDLITLYNMPSTTTRPAVATLFFASGLGVVTAVSLTTFIPRILQLGTPDGLVDEFESRLPPQEYQKRSRKYCQSGVQADHPLQPLHTLVMAALSRREWATAERGLHGFRSILTGTIIELSQSGELPSQNRDPIVNAMFELPLQDFLSEITVHAMENDERELARQAMDIQGEIGRIALEENRRFIAPHAVRGLRNTVLDTPATMNGSPVYQHAFRNLGDISEEVAKRPDPYELRTVLRTIDHTADVVLRRDAEHWVFEGFLLRYFDGTLPRIQETLLEYYGDYLRDVEIDWTQQRADDDLANRHLFEAFYTWRELFINTSRRIIAFREHNGEYPMTYGNFFSAWRRVCKEPIEAGVDEFGLVLIKIMIEMAYFCSHIDGDSRDTWASRLADLNNEGEEDIVQRAFDELHSSGPTGLVYYPIDEQVNEDSTGLIEAIRSRSNRSNQFQGWVTEFGEYVSTAFNNR